MNYPELSMYQLLCNRDVYHLIDSLCSQRFPGWDIVDFERAVVGGFSYGPCDEQQIRDLIGCELRRLSSERPVKRYLEEGQHVAYEIFLQPPEVIIPDKRPFLLFWAYVARAYGNEVLPMDKERCRAIYQTVLKEFKMRLYALNDFLIDRFSIPTVSGVAVPLQEWAVRDACFTIEYRNKAFSRKTHYEGGLIHLDRAKERLGAFLDRVAPAYRIREDFNAHDLCFAIDSSCTEVQREYVLLLWGTFTGKPLTFAECGRKCGVTSPRIRVCENTVVRNVGHGCRELIAQRVEEDRITS